MILFKHRRSAERDAFSVPRSVQKSIPIKRIYQDGVFQVSGKFSKTWRFFDVNYAVASPEKQRELFMTYCSFLNSLPIGATAKITLLNRQLNQKDFGRTLLMPMQGDRRDLYRNEYNALVLGKAAESNNLIQEKYITVSAEKKSVEEARAFFSRVGTDLTTGLSRMSSSVREITVNDRLRLLHDFYRPGEEQLFRFNLEDTMRRGHDFRDCIAPDCISFQKNHYELGNHVGRTLFLREYASFISDAMITELMDYPRNMMLSIDIIPVAMDEAVSDIRKRIMSVESDITRWQRRQNQNNNFTANIPYDLEQMRSETKEFMDDLMSRDQRMMLALVTLTHLADNLEQLDQDTEALQAIGRARGCQFNVLRYQQEDALNTVLPLGLKRIDATRTLTTECVEKELVRVREDSLAVLGEEEIIKKFPRTMYLEDASTVIVLKTPKTESSVRKVWMPKTVAYILREWKASQDKQKEFLGSEYLDYNLVVALPNGRPCEETVISNAFRRLKRDAQLPDVVFHSLRHSSTTYKLKLNHGDIKATQGDTGHSQADMVTKVYAHILDEDRKVNAQKFESAFYANPDLRGVQAPAEPAPALDVQSIILQLQQSPELLSALTSLISNQGCK